MAKNLAGPMRSLDSTGYTEPSSFRFEAATGDQLAFTAEKKARAGEGSIAAKEKRAYPAMALPTNGAGPKKAPALRRKPRKTSPSAQLLQAMGLPSPASEAKGRAERADPSPPLSALGAAAEQAGLSVSLNAIGASAAGKAAEFAAAQGPVGKIALASVLGSAANADGSVAEKGGLGASALHTQAAAAKDAVRSTARTVRAAGSAAEFAYKAAQAAGRAAAWAAKAFIAAASSASAAAVAGFIAAFAAMALLGSLFNYFFTAFLSIKSSAAELGKAQLAITRLDAEAEAAIKRAALKAGQAGATQNGSPIEAGSARIYTDADKAILYFDAKFGSYAFEAIEGEIAHMHSQLHSWSAEGGGEGAKISITSKSVDSYIEASGLSASQREMAALLSEAGQYLSIKELASPVGGAFAASERWGYRVGASGSVEMHDGIDIPMQEGGSALCALDGTVAETGENEWGMYAAVESAGGRRAVYASLESLSVAQGAAVKAGEAIGIAGTGENGRPSLHFSYKIGTEPANAAFFMDGYSGTQARYAALWLPGIGGAQGGAFIMPASGSVSSFTDQRSGSHANYSAIDIALPVGSPVYASQAGTVKLAEENGDYGYCVIIEHDGGYSTLYGHLSEYSCTAGQEVSCGDVVALSGNTGRSTGPHLHFEIRLNGARQDLRGYFSVSEGDEVYAGAPSGSQQEAGEESD